MDIDVYPWQINDSNITATTNHLLGIFAVNKPIENCLENTVITIIENNNRI